MNVPRRLLVLAVLSLAALCAASRTARAADEHPAAAHSTAAHADTPHAAGHTEAEPQLLNGPREALITALTTLIVFVALVAILGKAAWGPIAKGLQDREDKIRRDIEEAESARARAEATMKEYQAQLATAESKVREMMVKANADAEQIATNVRARAQREAQEAKENATREIDAARRDAVRQVHEQAAVLATGVASKILKRNLNADDQRDLVASSLDQLETIKA